MIVDNNAALMNYRMWGGLGTSIVSSVSIVNQSSSGSSDYQLPESSLSKQFTSTEDLQLK